MQQHVHVIPEEVWVFAIFFSGSANKKQVIIIKKSRECQLIHTFGQETIPKYCYVSPLPPSSKQQDCQVLSSVEQTVLAKPLYWIVHSCLKPLRNLSSFLLWSLARDISLVLATHSTHNLVASCSKHYIIWASGISFWNISHTNAQDQ